MEPTLCCNSIFYCYQLQWKVRQFGPVELLYNFPHVWMTYISRHKIWILRVLLRGRRARFNSCSEIFSFWKYSYKLLTNLEGPAALVRELDTFLIPCPLADLSIEWLQLFHQNIENGIWWFLQSVLYMGILAMTSKIYIVINYNRKDKIGCFAFDFFGSDLSKMDQTWSNLIKMDFSPIKKCFYKKFSHLQKK